MSRRDLLRDLFGRPKFQSRRERWTSSIISYSTMMPMVLLPISLERFDSTIWLLLWMGLGLALVSVGWLTWLTWGRKRFPLPAADESKSTA